MKGCIPDLDVALFELAQVIRINMIELKFEKLQSGCRVIHCHVYDESHLGTGTRETNSKKAPYQVKVDQLNRKIFRAGPKSFGYRIIISRYQSIGHLISHPAFQHSMFDNADNCHRDSKSLYDIHCTLSHGLQFPKTPNVS